MTIGAYWEDDPAVRLDNWFGSARSTISRESLYDLGFEGLAVELMRQRGESP